MAAPLLPPGTRPDVLDGRTFAGLIALRMNRTAVLGSPPLPWLGSFDQVNVRLYSVDEQGRRGVVFLSLDTGRLAAALAARQLARLPYAWARVQARCDGDRCEYRVERHGGAGRARITLRRGAALPVPGRLELFLTARWGVHHRLGGRTLYGQVEHGPWPLHTAELLACDSDLLAAAGLPSASGPPVSVLWSPGVDRVRIGLPA